MDLRVLHYVPSFSFRAAEGAALPNGELSWFLKKKLGPDPLRTQLLETALQGQEGYKVIECEVLCCSKISTRLIRCFDVLATAALKGLLVASVFLRHHRLLL